MNDLACGCNHPKGVTMCPIHDVTPQSDREQGEELPWTVEADRIRELLLEMHKPNCGGGGGQSETSCPACLCRCALYRLVTKIEKLVEK